MFHMFLDCWWKLGAKLFDNLDWECVSLDFSHNVWSGCFFLKCSDTRFPQSKKKCAYSDQLFHIILVLAEVDYLITLRFEEFRSLQVVFPFGGWCSLWSLNDLWSLSSHSAESRNSFSPPLPSGLLWLFINSYISWEFTFYPHSSHMNVNFVSSAEQDFGLLRLTPADFTQW